MDLQNLFSFQCLGNQTGGRFKRLFPGANPYGFDRVSGDAFVKSTRNDFNLWKFGHES
jgi:hypothetical protein